MMTNSLVVLTSDRAGEREELQQGQTAFSSCEYNYPIKALFQDFTSSRLICVCVCYFFNVFVLFSCTDKEFKKRVNKKKKCACSNLTRGLRETID